MPRVFLNITNTDKYIFSDTDTDGHGHGLSGGGRTRTRFLLSVSCSSDHMVADDRNKSLERISDYMNGIVREVSVFDLDHNIKDKQLSTKFSAFLRTTKETYDKRTRNGDDVCDLPKAETKINTVPAIHAEVRRNYERDEMRVRIVINQFFRALNDVRFSCQNESVPN